MNETFKVLYKWQLSILSLKSNNVENLLLSLKKVFNGIFSVFKIPNFDKGNHPALDTAKLLTYPEKE